MHLVFFFSTLILFLVFNDILAYIFYLLFKTLDSLVVKHWTENPLIVVRFHFQGYLYSMENNVQYRT